LNQELNRFKDAILTFKKILSLSFLIKIFETFLWNKVVYIRTKKQERGVLRLKKMTTFFLILFCRSLRIQKHFIRGIILLRLGGHLILNR